MGKKKKSNYTNNNSIRYLIDLYQKANPSVSREHIELAFYNLEEGELLMSEPAIQKWLETKSNKYGGGGSFYMPSSNLPVKGTKITSNIPTNTPLNFGQSLKVGAANAWNNIKTGQANGLVNSAATAIGGLLAGGNESAVGNAMQSIGSLASNIPGVGGLIGAGVNLLGGIVNAGFGSNIDKEFVNQTEAQARQQSNYVSGASDNASLISNWNALTFLGDVSKSDVGSDGWFSNKAGRETDRLNTLVDEANAKALASITNTAKNIDKQNDLMLMANYSAYGGSLNKFDEGGYTNVYEMPFALKVEYSRTGKITNTGYPITPLNKGYNTLRALGRFRKAFKREPWDPNGAFTKAVKGYILDAKNTTNSENKKNLLQFSKYLYNLFVGNKGQNLGLSKYESENKKEMKNEEKVDKLTFGGPLNKFDNGGELFTNGVTTIGNGGTHEENPYEGVQMGVDPQGIPNLVEEGEVIYNDYVFSNRLRVPKEVRLKYKLRGITFAECAKWIQKESEERPNDPISKNGLNALMQMLMNEQEMIRDKKENNKFARGGRLCNKFLLGGDPTIDNPYSPYRNNKNDYSRWFTLDPNNSSKVTSYSDPYKNLIFTADMARAYAKNNPNDESLKSFLSRGNKLENLTDEDVQKGSLDTNFGWLHKARANAAKSLDYIDVSKLPTRDEILSNLDRLTGTSILNRNNTKVKDVPIVIEDEVIDEEPLPSYKGIEPMKTNWLRYTPIVGSGLAVANDLFGGNEPDYSNADIFARAIEGTNRTIGARQIGNYLTYTPFDKERYINTLNANTAASRRGIVNTSGGNRAAAMAGLLATDFNYGNQLGDLARQAEEYNLAQRQAVEEFNRGTNMTNAEMAMKADMANAEQAMQRARMYGSLAEYRDKILAANRAEKSANLTNFIQGLSDLGTELTDKDKLRWLADLGVLKYDGKGKYTGDNKSNETAKGGRINRKKRGGFTI